MQHRIPRLLLAAALGTFLTAGLFPAPASASAPAGLAIEIGDVTLGAGSAGVDRYVVLAADERVSTTEVTFTFDTADLTGVATLAPQMYGFTCSTAGTLTTCSYYYSWPFEFGPGGLSAFPVTVAPDPNAALGDTGTFDYSITVDGATASGSSHVVIGEGVDLAVGTSWLEVAGTAGSTIDIEMTVRNVGDTAVHGAVLWLGFGNGVRLAPDYGNCHYQVDRDSNAYCEFDTELAPGASYATPLRVEIDGTVRSPGTVWGNVQWSTPDDFATRGDDRVFVPGTGATLPLEPVVSAARLPQTDVSTSDNFGYIAIELTGLNPADLSASGATTDGPAGSVRTIQVGMRNDGPATIDNRQAGEAAAHLKVEIPAGTTLVEADPGCWPSEDYYVCSHPASLFPAGTEVSFPITLRIDRVMPNATARVSVNQVVCHICNDGNASNDVAYLVVNG
jgi:hypothetical protein